MYRVEVYRLTNNLTNLLNSWSRVLFKKLIITQLVKKLPTFYGSQMFITVFVTSRHWSLYWAIWIQSTTSHPISLRSVLILSYHLCLSRPSGVFPSGFSTKILYAFLITPMLAKCPAHLILLDLITLTIFPEAYELWSLSPNSSHLGPNILLSTLFSDILKLCFFLSKRVKISHQYETAGKIMCLYILIYKIFKRRRENKRLSTGL